VTIFVRGGGFWDIAQRWDIRNSSSIPPFSGVYPKLGSDVNELSAIASKRGKKRENADTN